MKKMAVCIILAFAAGFPLHAQLGPGIGIGGWARYVFSPIGGTGTVGESFDKDDLRVSARSNTASFFPQRGKIGLAAWGNSDYVGFNFDFAYQNSALEVGDQAQVWIRPLDMLMLHAGKIQGNALRGKIAGGQFVTMEEEDDIFFRFYPQFGILTDFTPIENMYIGASIDAGANIATAFNVYDPESASTSSGYQIGAGYQFSFGHLRAQFISLQSGDAASSLYKSGKPIQAAFAFTDIYNLTIELSGKYPVMALLDSPASVTLAAEYIYERLTAMGRFTYIGYPDPSHSGDYRIKAAGIIKYSINFPLFLGLELAYAGDNPITAAIDDMLQIAPYAGLRYGRGEFRIGFYWQQGFKADKNAYVFEIPLLFEAKFF